MNWESTDLPETWNKFEQHVRFILNGPHTEKDEPVKATYLLLSVGEKGRDKYNTYTLTNDDKKNLKEHFDIFSKKCFNQNEILSSQNTDLILKFKKVRQ